MRSTTARSRLVAAAAASLVGLAGLAACSAGGGSASSDAASVQSFTDSAGSAESGGGSDTAAKAPAAVSGSGAADKASGTGTVVDPAVAERKVTRRADLSLEVPDVPAAAARVRAVAAAAGGLVVAEDIRTDPGTPTPEPAVPEKSTEGAEPTSPPANGTITVSVPADRLDATLDQLAAIGRVVARHTTTDDVTAQYVDTESRVKSAQASVDRVRALMTQATKLADVVTLEAELSRRQADLEALESQLTALKGQVALSPVTVYLATDVEALPPTDDTGFLAGLAAGWTAFTASVTVLLTALGAVLPFAVVLALVLVPAWLWWRRRAPRATTPPAAPVPAAPAPPAAPSA